MAHQMAQKGALWPSVIRFGPHWCNSKITWADIVNAVLDFGTKSIIVLPMLNMFGAVKNTLAQQELDLSQFGASQKSDQKLLSRYQQKNYHKTKMRQERSLVTIVRWKLLLCKQSQKPMKLTGWDRLLGWDVSKLQFKYIPMVSLVLTLALV